MSRLRHDERYTGIYTTSSGIQRRAYLMWRKDKEGFVVFDANTNRPLINTAYPNLSSMLDNRVNFRRVSEVEEIYYPI